MEISVYTSNIIVTAPMCSAATTIYTDHCMLYVYVDICSIVCVCVCVRLDVLHELCQVCSYHLACE